MHYFPGDTPDLRKSKARGRLRKSNRHMTLQDASGASNAMSANESYGQAAASQHLGMATSVEQLSGVLPHCRPA